MGIYGFSGDIPWRRAWQPTPVFLPGESHGQRSLAGYSPWCRKELEAAERLTHSWFTSCVTLRCMGPHSRAHVCRAGTLSASCEALRLAVLRGCEGWDAGFGTTAPLSCWFRRPWGREGYRLDPKREIQPMPWWGFLAPWELRRAKKENLSPSFFLFLINLFYFCLHSVAASRGRLSGDVERASHFSLVVAPRL